MAERQPAVGGQITVDVAEDMLVLADRMRLTQVLDNLVTNALRYGGPNVHVSARRDDTYVRLTVADDGDGVPEELLATLFRAYARGEASHTLGGSGLGLLIVRQLCEAMGGSVEHDGTDGTRFTASFPAVPVPTRAGARPGRGRPLGRPVAQRREAARRAPRLRGPRPRRR